MIRIPFNYDDDGIKWPVFFVDGNDISVGKDASHFRSRFEEIDLFGGEIELFDANGHRLVAEPRRSGYALVFVPDTAAPSSLVAKLRYYLQGAKQVVADSEPIESLVEKMNQLDKG